jgi:hypothetical protein
MSTRGILGYRQNGKDFLHYNHSDSYPENLGLRVMAMVFNGAIEPVEPDKEEDCTDFTGDSVFCQYAYIINNDDQVLEYYKGVNTDANAAGRYAKSGSWTDSTDGKTYYGIRLVKNIPYDVIRSTPEADWVKLFEEVK